MKTQAITLYLVLPADRLETFGRWWRLLERQAITVNARNIARKPKQPILFMAALGHLRMVEQAHRFDGRIWDELWSIVQDASQLEAIFYGKSWQTTSCARALAQCRQICSTHSTSRQGGTICGYQHGG